MAKSIYNYGSGQVSDNATTEVTNEGRQQTRNNLENYMSPYPSTSYSHNQTSSGEGLDPPSHDSTAGETSTTLENSI